MKDPQKRFLTKKINDKNPKKDGDEKSRTVFIK